MMIGINPDYDYLYDPQQARPAGRCPACGAEIYTPNQDLCDWCSRLEVSE